MKYTHRDRDGMLWRFDGARPVSLLADIVMAAAGMDKMNNNTKKRWKKLTKAQRVAMAKAERKTTVSRMTKGATECL